MRIYYHAAYKRSNVPPSAPIEATEDEAKNILARFLGHRSFMGILLGTDRTLQLYRKADGAFPAEILNQADLTVRYCVVNIPLAEMLIEAAFRNEDFEEKIAFSRVVWSDKTLKK